MALTGTTVPALYHPLVGLMLPPAAEFAEVVRKYCVEKVAVYVVAVRGSHRVGGSARVGPVGEEILHAGGAGLIGGGDGVGRARGPLEGAGRCAGHAIHRERESRGSARHGIRRSATESLGGALRYEGAGRTLVVELGGNPTRPAYDVGDPHLIQFPRHGVVVVRGRVAEIQGVCVSISAPPVSGMAVDVGSIQIDVDGSAVSRIGQHQVVPGIQRPAGGKGNDAYVFVEERRLRAVRQEHRHGPSAVESLAGDGPVVRRAGLVEPGFHRNGAGEIQRGGVRDGDHLGSAVESSPTGYLSSRSCAGNSGRIVGVDGGIGCGQ